MINKLILIIYGVIITIVYIVYRYRRCDQVSGSLNMLQLDFPQKNVPSRQRWQRPASRLYTLPVHVSGTGRYGFNL